MKLPEKIAHYQDRIELALKKNLKDNVSFPSRLHDAMCYAVFGNGKRLRPLLVYTTAESLGGSLDQCDEVASAIEFIHCYSLVHDDLPAMDNDEFRRGRNSCHIEYDEATAILVGDALQSLAFECLTNSIDETNSKQRLLIVSELAKASGFCGMAGGQALDLNDLTETTTLETIEKIYSLKTGALLTAAIRMGALSANISDDQQLQLLTDYAKTIGLAFQIQDDIFDKKIESAEMPLSSNKACYASIGGIEHAKKYVKELFEKADSMLELLGLRDSPLSYLTTLIKNRSH